MRLAGGVADTENPVGKCCTDSGSDRSSRKPELLGALRASARWPNPHRHDASGAARSPPLALRSCGTGQGAAADAAGKAYALRVAPHHTSIAAGKYEQGHEIERQVGTIEMRLKGKEVGRLMRQPAIGQPGALLPRSVGRDNSPGEQKRAVATVTDFASPALVQAFDIADTKRLPEIRARFDGSLERRKIENARGRALFPTCQYGLRLPAYPTC